MTVVLDASEQTCSFGLSLGDRTSLGLRLGVAVLTSDRLWLNLNFGLDILAVR